MVILDNTFDIKKLKSSLLEMENNLKSSLIKDGNKVTYFNIYLLSRLSKDKICSFDIIKEAFDLEEALAKKFIIMNYLQEGQNETDDILMLKKNRFNILSFQVSEGVFLLTLDFKRGNKRVCFPSLKYLSEFLDTGNSIFHDDDFDFNIDLIESLFYI